MTQELKDRIIHALGGHTEEEFDKEHKNLLSANAELEALRARHVAMRAEVECDELENVARMLGDNIEGWRDLLLNCRLGAQVRAAARITDYGDSKVARVVVLSEEDDNERNSKAD